MVDYLILLQQLRKGKTVRFRGKKLIQSAVDGKLYFSETDNEGRPVLLYFDYTVNQLIDECKNLSELTIFEG